jgi:hypothetical protein
VLFGVPRLHLAGISRRKRASFLANWPLELFGVVFCPALFWAHTCK